MSNSFNHTIQNVNRIFVRHVHNVFFWSDLDPAVVHVLLNQNVDLLSSMRIAGYPPILLLSTSLRFFSFDSPWSFRFTCFTISVPLAIVDSRLPRLFLSTRYIYQIRQVSCNTLFYWALIPVRNRQWLDAKFVMVLIYSDSQKYVDTYRNVLWIRVSKISLILKWSTIIMIILIKFENKWKYIDIANIQFGEIPKLLIYFI